MNRNEFGRLSVVGVVAGAVVVVAASLLGQGEARPQHFMDTADDALKETVMDNSRRWDGILKSSEMFGLSLHSTVTEAEEYPEFAKSVESIVGHSEEHASQHDVLVVAGNAGWLCVCPSGDVYVISDRGIATPVCGIAFSGYKGFNARFSAQWDIEKMANMANRRSQDKPLDSK